jgi:RND superfamily putative drug exporter
VSIASDLSLPVEHEPSPGPDERALFSRLAASMATHRRVVILVWVVVTVAAAPLAITLTKALSGAGWDAKGSTAEQVRMELRKDFPALGAENPIVVYRQDSPIADDPAGLRALEAELINGPRVLSVADPLAMPAEAGMISRDGMTALVPVEQQIGEDKDRPEAAGELGSFVRGLTIADGASAEVTGEWPVWADFNQMNEAALHKAELLSGLPTLIMLFIAFGALLAAGIPLILAIAGIATGFASLHLLSAISPMSVWSMNFSMMIGLAVGIDYSLFIVSRYREERVEGKDAIKAIESAMSTSSKAVFLSALTVVLSLAAVFLVPVMVFQTMALGHDHLGHRGRPRGAHPPPSGPGRVGRQGADRSQQKGPRHRRRGPLGEMDRRRAAPPRPHVDHRSRPPRCAGPPGVRHEAGHARRARRRSGSHESRRL